MKKRFLSLAAMAVIMISLALSLSGCGQPRLRCMEMILYPQSHSEKEVKTAFESVRDGFSKKFKNSQLVSLTYSEPMQEHLGLHPEEDMVVSVSICGDHYETVADRADYFCFLSEDSQGNWLVKSWCLNRNTRPRP